jgi:UDP-N-acetylmuramoyl-tripeptide--D-alanyl-D-alanine ligase
MTVTDHNHLIVDAYNANPTSMKAAIDNFKMITADRKMAILGQMGELGDDSVREHQKMVDMLTEAGFDVVWLVGDNFRDIPCPFRKFKDVTEVKAAIAKEQPQGYYILIKGSNTNRLFELPESL